MTSLSAARRTRLHRTSAAQFLVTLESSCSLDDLAGIDWMALDNVPHWCFTDQVESNRIQLVCGTVFLAPLIAQWIDGSRLKQARTLVGANYFDAAMHAGAGLAASQQISTSEEVPELLASAGASVLVVSVEHAAIRKLLAEQFPMSVESIDENVAKQVYQLALDVIDQTEGRTVQASNAI